ncbi:hypothetical protein [Paraburkholderia kururiensis]|uniref:hypothetical protein n=1 Tax=Paraburkholderia kururiensis TaxID=984307 RepID=UPI0012E00B54|nr:hypothetical protein [Paraburkholderia kururiensis]
MSGPPFGCPPGGIALTGTAMRLLLPASAQTFARADLEVVPRRRLAPLGQSRRP